MALRVEVPNLSQGKNENDDVRCDVRYGVADEEMLSVYTLGFGVHFIPETVDGIAGEDGDQDDRDPPCNNHSLHDVRSELEFRHGEDSAVKGENGELDCQDGGAVEKLVCKEALFSG